MSKRPRSIQSEGVITKKAKRKYEEALERGRIHGEGEKENKRKRGGVLFPIVIMLCNLVADKDKKN